MSILDPLYQGVASVVVGIHSGIEPVFGATNGFGWGLSIVLLTLGVRIILFPLFVKQIKSQRTMQMMAPKMKEIKEKHKNDRQKMNAELMALQKEHGNPLLGCLPIFAQIPLFIALFRVLNAITPKLDSRTHQYVFVPSHGLSAAQEQTIGSAKIFGVPLASAFRSGSGVLDKLGVHSSGGVKAVALVLIIVMCSTTFLTQKQIQGRNPSVDPSQRTQQKLLLYLAPGMLAISGFIFPIGVLVYWLTTNVWSMGQQFFVLRRMPPVVPVLTTGSEREAARAQAAAPPKPSRQGLLRPRAAVVPTPVDRDNPRAKLRPERHTPPTTPVSGASPARPTASRPPQKKQSKNGKNRRGGRR